VIVMDNLAQAPRSWAWVMILLRDRFRDRQLERWAQPI
jgi:hypothetical protein